ncbi:hypothetical protein DPMN_052499 [Dreissena polymorpha]|uniref:Uncharacterized protein n=1 Tax=Dreissena polymorpha TaxID=45954 RepID=A0A9D4CL06_DREPO|nr:hypothetical protein DPMN_052499 [Dreissena polymorpha]
MITICMDIRVTNEYLQIISGAVPGFLVMGDGILKDLLGVQGAASDGGANVAPALGSAYAFNTYFLGLVDHFRGGSRISGYGGWDIARFAGGPGGR